MAKQKVEGKKEESWAKKAEECGKKLGELMNEYNCQLVVEMHPSNSLNQRVFVPQIVLAQKENK